MLLISNSTEAHPEPFQYLRWSFQPLTIFAKSYLRFLTGFFWLHLWMMCWLIKGQCSHYVIYFICNLIGWFPQDGKTRIDWAKPLVPSFITVKSSHRRRSIKNAVLRIFAIFTGKHLCWSLFLIKLTKKTLQHRRFPVNIAKFLRTSLLKNICERLLLSTVKTFKALSFFTPPFQASHTIRPTIWYQLFTEFWLVHTWYFAHLRHQRPVPRLENVRQLNES